MKILVFAWILFSALPAMAQIEGKSGGKLKPEQAIMDIRHYTVQLDVNVDNHSIRGATTIRMVTLEPTSTLLFDLSDSLPVSSVTVDGKKVSFKHAGNLVHITAGSSLPAGKHETKISYGGTPIVAKRPPWKGGFTWEQDSTGNPFIAVTCQLEGAKIYFPCKDHPSDEAEEGAELIITVPKGLTVTGPGLLISSKTSAGRSTFHWKTNYTINNYSIVFNAAKYQLVRRNYKTIDGNTVPMEFYVLAEHASKAEKHLDIFERTVRQEEKYFGEYPWAKERIGICEIPHLGMEHQTNNAYGNHFRYSKVGGEDYDWLMHHEFGHEWWGNKVTANDWADMWIQEGIDTYGDALYIRDYDGEEAYMRRMRETAMHTSNKVPIVQGKDLDTDTVYTGDIYGKGALFMHTLRYVIGDSIFFPALKAFATSPAFTYTNRVVTKDVLDHFSKAAGMDLKPLFDLFIYSTNKLDIHIKQTNPGEYAVSISNIAMNLPVNLIVDGKPQKTVLGAKPVVIKASSPLLADPDGWYLKRIIWE